MSTGKPVALYVTGHNNEFLRGDTIYCLDADSCRRTIVTPATFTKIEVADADPLQGFYLSVWNGRDLTIHANFRSQYVVGEIVAILTGVMEPATPGEPVLAPESPIAPKLKADEPPSTPDPVKPSHYDLAGGLDLLDVMPDDMFKGFCLGNVFKYVLRAGRKVGASTLEDLRKAREYLDRAIKRLEAQ